MKKLLIFVFVFLFATTPIAYAVDPIENGLQFLKSKQDATGRITTGFSSPSQWTAIAFQAHSIDSTTVKNPTTSLYEFLLTDLPTNDSATEWETRILAIVAIGENPANFNGTNYVEKLESFYDTHQIGDTCSLNDDIFGILALVASGELASNDIKQNVLSFLTSKQDSSDGGFGFSAPGCSWYSTSADMTGAGLHALVAAKNAGITHTELDNAIEKAKNYLLANQNSDGGYGYFGSSDTDTTGWVLIGLNALNMQDSEQALKAKTYLLTQQASSDGGFTAFDWGSSTFISNATTTAHALIALSGKTWILQTYTPASADSPSTPSPSLVITARPTPTSTPSPTPPTGLSSVEQTTLIYQTITITTTPSPKTRRTKTETHQAPQTLGETTKRNIPTGTSAQTDAKQNSKTVTVLGAATQNYAYIFITLGSFIISSFFIIRALQKIKAKKQFTNHV